MAGSDQPLDRQRRDLAVEPVIDKSARPGLARRGEGAAPQKAVKREAGKSRRCARNCKRRAPPLQVGRAAMTREPGDLPSPSSVPGRDQPAVRGVPWPEAVATPP